MTSFTKAGSETSDVFRKEKKEIPELKLDEVEVDIFEAKEIMKKVLKEKYSFIAYSTDALLIYDRCKKDLNLLKK